MAVEPTGHGKIWKEANYTEWDETGHQTMHGNGRDNGIRHSLSD